MNTPHRPYLSWVVDPAPVSYEDPSYDGHVRPGHDISYDEAIKHDMLE